MVLYSLERERRVSRDFALTEKHFRSQAFHLIGQFLDWPWNWWLTWHISRKVRRNEPLPDDVESISNANESDDDVDMADLHEDLFALPFIEIPNPHFFRRINLCRLISLAIEGS